MATRKATSSDTEGQRTVGAVTSAVPPDVDPSTPEQPVEKPDAASAALRDFVRALARAAVERDWAAAIQKLDKKEADDDPNDAAT